MDMKMIACLNAECFGRSDMYSDPDRLKDLKHLTVTNGIGLVSFLSYADLPDYLSIVRMGTKKESRKRGNMKRLLSRLKRLSRKLNKPIRTYIAYDNLPSYLLHLKLGFYPTHVAWNQFVWVEYKPKGP